VKTLPKVFPKNIVRAFEKSLSPTQVLSKPEELLTYECEATLLFKGQPNLVVLPKTTQQVAQIVKTCIEYKLPFVARGAGTGLSGGSVADSGGVIISLANMNQITEVDPINQTATVQPGVVNASLNQLIKPIGLFYAPDPSSQSACTIGGNIAENAGGIHCLKYGVTVDHILSLELVTPEGDIIWLGNATGKNALCNWTGLVVGSEGTFGIVTQAILKLTPSPPITLVYLLSYNQVSLATQTVSQIIASGTQPAAMEFMDAFTIQSVNTAFNYGFSPTAKAILLIELDGTVAEIQAQQKQLEKVIQQFPPEKIDVAKSQEERELFWKGRKSAAASYGHYAPSFYLHDCVIPRRKLTEIITRIEDIAKKYQVMIGNVFHAGDGNLHPNILFNPNDPDLLERSLKAGEEILKACLAVGGVLSGEHGIGLEKQAYMTDQYNEETLKLMLELKQVFDPQCLSNPGKILPKRSTCGEIKAQEKVQQLVTSGEAWV
jgi:glycolate oxidase